MMKAEFIRVARIDELHEQRGKLIAVDGEDVALFKRDGVVYALQNVCSHQHYSKLHDGEIEGLTVRCPMHGWTYDMITGRAINGDGRVRTYKVRIESENVFIEVKREMD
jgi:naphthalene 1,2-dioxygenase system ferredoxin subunit